LTLVLLDTNAYLRLAKRIKPMLGVRFGQKEYELAVLKDVEEEVHRSAKLKFLFPWFDDGDLTEERLAKGVRLKREEREQLDAAASTLHGWVLAHVHEYTTKGRSPPSLTDCRMLAFGQIRPAIVVTDDLGMHHLASTFIIGVWHGHELLKKMLTAKLVSPDLVREIYEALENNTDLPATWRDTRHIAFRKIFGAPPN
jgi:hypothetical protein